MIPNRKDDPEAVMAHAGKYAGGKALAVLGGPSGARWREVYAQVKPDVILGANGVNSGITSLDYWVLSENMAYAIKTWRSTGDPHWGKIVEMFYRETGARTKMINHKNWQWMKDVSRCVKIRRCSYREMSKKESPLVEFNLREYGDGLLSGWSFRDPHYHTDQQVGTTGTQLLHLAGILGCREVHTVGFDLVLPAEGQHHWYDYPRYRPDHFRKPANFIEYGGVNTQKVWVEGALFLTEMIPHFEEQGMHWFDHSNGLFAAMGLECAVG